MKNLILLLVLTAIQANASIKTSVMHIGNAIDSSEELEIHVSYDGRVFNVEKENNEMIKSLQFAQKNNLEVEIEVENGEVFDVLNEVERITKVTLISTESLLEGNIKSSSTSEISHPMSGYAPSNVDSYDKAKEVFDRLSKDTRHKGRSQCFNRAYIWSKKMLDEDNIHSMKIFVFYTSKYRKEVSKKWWYHVAPMISVQGELYVMDKEFTRKPVTDVEWEQKFAANRIGDKEYRCAGIKNINQYYDSENMASNYCNILHASMYYRGPIDLKNTANKGTLTTAFENWKIKSASKEAFKKWKKVYEARKLQ